MGRLAVDQPFKEQGLGGALLADALDYLSNGRQARSPHGVQTRAGFEQKRD